MSKEKKSKKLPPYYWRKNGNTHRCRHCDEDGIRCQNRRKGKSMFCSDHGPSTPRKEAIKEIVKGNIVATKYKYTLSEFKEFVTNEIQQLPSEILNCFEELAIMKATTQWYICKLEEARNSGDDRDIQIWTNKLNHHINDTTKVAQRLWSMQQPTNNIPSLHVIAVLNQIQDFVRGYISDDQFNSFSNKLNNIKIGIGDFRQEEEGITKEDLKAMLMTIPQPPEDDVIDV